MLPGIFLYCPLQPTLDGVAVLWSEFHPVIEARAFLERENESNSQLSQNLLFSSHEYFVQDTAQFMESVSLFDVTVLDEYLAHDRVALQVGSPPSPDVNYLLSKTGEILQLLLLEDKEGWVKMDELILAELLSPTTQVSPFGCIQVFFDRVIVDPFSKVWRNLIHPA
ncbi:hypothetical protein OF83DRAFT_1180925 [Amylostereum chailletii]|nr:hypothetical protein OF83DRAFT_1180925 [Amylostereum chailletii]